MINEDVIVFKYKNSKFDSLVSYFCFVDSKILFMNVVCVLFMN